MNATAALRPATDGSLRHHPGLAALFQAAESRHLTDDELAIYVQVVPEHADRAQAARAVRDAEDEVVPRLLEEIFAAFPFEEKIEYSPIKCNRDVRYMVAYLTLAMLQNDARWLDQTFLQWVKSILRAFDFPPRREAPDVLFDEASPGAELPDHLQAIHATYTGLRDGFGRALDGAHYDRMRPWFDTAIETLLGD